MGKKKKYEPQMNFDLSEVRSKISTLHTVGRIFPSDLGIKDPEDVSVQTTGGTASSLAVAPWASASHWPSHCWGGTAELKQSLITPVSATLRCFTLSLM